MSVSGRGQAINPFKSKKGGIYVRLLPSLPLALTLYAASKMTNKTGVKIVRADERARDIKRKDARARVGRTKKVFRFLNQYIAIFIIRSPFGLFNVANRISFGDRTK